MTFLVVQPDTVSIYTFSFGKTDGKCATASPRLTGSLIRTPTLAGLPENTLADHLFSSQDGHQLLHQLSLLLRALQFQFRTVFLTTTRPMFTFSVYETISGLFVAPMAHAREPRVMTIRGCGVHGVAFIGLVIHGDRFGVLVLLHVYC